MSHKDAVSGIRHASLPGWLPAERSIIAFCVAMVLGIMVLFGFLITESRHEQIAHAEENARNLSVALQRDIDRNMEVWMLSLRAIVEGRESPWVRQLPADEQRLVLFDRALSARYVSSASVVDIHGRVVLSSHRNVPDGMTLAGRPYFSYHREHDDRKVLVSDPLTSRITGIPIVVISARIDDDAGAFAGVATIALELSYFTDLLRDLNIGPNGIVAILRTDGSLVTRKPPLRGDQTKRASLAGTSNFQRFLRDGRNAFIGRAAIDAKQRLYVFQRAPHSDMVISVAPALQDILAQWRLRFLLPGAFIMLFGIVLVFMSWLLSSLLRRRTRAELELWQQANTDALTGLMNRRALRARMNEHWPRIEQGTPFSAFFVDVDFFKAFNDRYGHLAGDRVLVAVANAIDDVVGPDMPVARFGGEEFTVLLPGVPIEQATQLGQRTCAAVSALDIAHEASLFGTVTVSVGIASTSREHFATPADLLHAADLALYRAKRLGRNRVEVCRH